MGCDAQLASRDICRRYPVEVSGANVWVVLGEFLGNLSAAGMCGTDSFRPAILLAQPAKP